MALLKLAEALLTINYKIYCHLLADLDDCPLDAEEILRGS